MNDELNRGRPGRRPNQVRLLYRVSTAINAALDVERVLSVAMDSMDELFGFRRCSVYLHDPDSGRLVLRATRGEPDPRQRERERIGRGIVGTAAAKREVVRLNRAIDADGEPSSAVIESRMAIPMLADEEVVGVLFVLTVRDKVLRKDDEELVTIVANQAAVALQNARLYEGLQELNTSLEERVRERTAELENANLELQRTQSQLVQSGKMAALGQLAAGLSHEMNTPLGAIQSSLDVAERALALLREHGLAPEDATGKLGRALTAMQDSGRVSREACERLFSVFRTLRDFARLDEADLQWADLHEGLEQTLGVLGHRLQHIEVVRDFGALPEVRCRAGEINQVFLTVLTNAADAMEARGTLTLRSRAETDRVRIEVSDDGRGMTPAQLELAFDPRFTTKGSRVGSGLGLGIAYRIMEGHGGSIAVESAEGRGTTVTLSLPVDGASAG